MQSRSAILVCVILCCSLFTACGNANSVSIQTRDGTLTLTYPQAWLAEPTGPTLVLANNRDAQIGMNNLGIFGLLTGHAGGLAFTAGANRGDTAADVLAFAQTQTFSTDGEAAYTFDEAETRQFGDKSGVVAHGTATFVATTLDVVLIVVDFENGYGILLFATPTDEMDSYLETAYTIADSMTFTPR